MGHRDRPQHHHGVTARRALCGGAHPDGERAALKTVTHLAAWFATAAVVTFALVRLAGLERAASPLVPVVAFTPQVALVAVLLGGAALLVRARAAAVVAVVVALVLAACMVPRAVAGGPHPDGPDLRVMTANIHYGLSDKSQLTQIVRRERVDVLVLAEFTGESRRTLSRRGLDRVLPYHSFEARPGSDGTAVYSRHPVTPLGALVGKTERVQARARIAVPGTLPLEITCVHAQSPRVGRNSQWRATLRQLPVGKAGRPALLVGDFNASLDHAEMRRLLGRGWSDAADRTGDGLVGTWPAQVSPFPTVALDHVLVSPDLGVRRTEVHDLRNSDHRAVLAVVELPAA